MQIKKEGIILSAFVYGVWRDIAEGDDLLAVQGVAHGITDIVHRNLLLMEIRGKGVAGVGAGWLHRPTDAEGYFFQPFAELLVEVLHVVGFKLCLGRLLLRCGGWHTDDMAHEEREHEFSQLRTGGIGIEYLAYLIGDGNDNLHTFAVKSLVLRLLADEAERLLVVVKIEVVVGEVRQIHEVTPATEVHHEKHAERAIYLLAVCLSLHGILR